jgi:flagellar basal-body rod protein FlgC
MSVFSALDIASTGLTAQRQRIEVISSNLANAGATRTADGGPYRRKDLVFESTTPDSTFAHAFGSALGMEQEAGVRVIGVYEDASPFLRKYEPNHPDADTEGYVLYPNVNPIEEMVNLLSATRSFEANAQAVNAIKEIAAKSMEIGK